MWIDILWWGGCVHRKWRMEWLQRVTILVLLGAARWISGRIDALPDMQMSILQQKRLTRLVRFAPRAWYTLMRRCCGKRLRTILAMLWGCYYYICCTAAAGRQAGPRHVFSGAVAAIFPTTKHATYWTEILPRCCRSAMSLRVPMQSLMPFSIDCHRWFLCCTWYIAAPQWFWFVLLL